MLALSLLVAADGLLPKAARAETRMAAALTPEAVGAAIDVANDGDTVLLPAGTGVWSKKSWNTGHSPMVKAITIQGAGIDQTALPAGSWTMSPSSAASIAFPTASGVKAAAVRVSA